MIGGLNTLRYFAFLSIFLFHTIPGFTKGFLGVDFFFVLSGFLLTWLGLKEVESTKTFSTVNFLMRRVLRIFPLYFLIVILSFFVIPQLVTLMGETIQLPEKGWMYWLFLSNYDHADCFYPLKFLWSIAVEEQFYLGFGLLGIILFRNIYATVAFLVAAYVGFMVYASAESIPTYMNTLTHFPKFAAGILLGFLYFKNVKTNAMSLVGLPLGFVGIIFLENELLFHLSASLFFAAIVDLVVHHWKSVEKWMIFKWTEHLGKYTYGLYIYSGLVIVFFTTMLGKQSLLTTISAFIVLHLVAVLSWYGFERHFLKLKSRFRS